jgi:hypothetical protein
VKPRDLSRGQALEGKRFLQRIILIITEVMEDQRWGAIYRRFTRSEELRLAVVNTRSMRGRITPAIFCGDNPYLFAAMHIDTNIPGHNDRLAFIARLTQG